MRTCEKKKRRFSKTEVNTFQTCGRKSNKEHMPGTVEPADVHIIMRAKQIKLRLAMTLTTFNSYIIIIV